MKNTPKCTPGNRICGKRCINENQTCLTDTNHEKYGGLYNPSERAKIKATYRNKDMTLREKDARFKKLHGKNTTRRFNKLMVKTVNEAKFPINSNYVSAMYREVLKESDKSLKEDKNNFDLKKAYNKSKKDSSR